MMSTLSQTIKQSSLRRLALTILMMCLGLGTTLALAQDQEESSEQATEEAGEQVEKEEQEQTEETTQPEGKRSGDTFVPSEGISEDLSVSFPVDI